MRSLLPAGCGVKQKAKEETHGEDVGTIVANQIQMTPFGNSTQSGSISFL